MPVNAAYTIYLFLNHHCTNSLSSLHIFVHHCTFCASLHTKTSPVKYHYSPNIIALLVIRPTLWFSTCVKIFVALWHGGRLANLVCSAESTGSSLVRDSRPTAIEESYYNSSRCGMKIRPAW